MKRFVLGLALFAAAAPASATNLITNGDFETGDFTGWTATSAFQVVPTYVAFGNGSFDVYGFNAGSGTLSQNLSLVAGQTYTLSFLYFGGLGYDPGAVSVDIGNLSTVFLSFGGSNTFTSQFTATGNDSLAIGGVGANQAMRFDDFSVTALSDSAVPEPGTWAMMLVGFALIGGALRRRRTVMHLHA